MDRVIFLSVSYGNGYSHEQPESNALRTEIDHPCNVKVKSANSFSASTRSTPGSRRFAMRFPRPTYIASTEWVPTKKLHVDVSGCRLTLRGRVQVPDWSRGRVLCCGARGDTSEAYEPLQRLSGLTTTLS